MSDAEPTDPQHYRRLERMYLGARTNEYYRPCIEVNAGRATVTVPVREDFFHPFAVHGSVYFKVLDDAAFFAASSAVTDVFLLTSSFTVYMLRPVTGGEMIGHGTLVHRSGRVLLAEATLVDEQGQQLGRGSGTFLRSRMPLTPEFGYA